MKKIGILPILLNKKKEVNYKLMEKMLKKIEGLDAITIFSNKMEGLTFSSIEKKEIFNKIKNMTDVNIIYEVSSILLDEEIQIIKEIKPDYLMLTLLNNEKIKNIGNELYIINKMKKLTIPFYIKNERNIYGNYIDYKNIIKLRRILPFFKGMYEETDDYNFLYKASKIEGIETYTSLINYINKPVDYKITGIMSDLFIPFYNEINEYFIEYEHSFINPILKDYLILVEDIISEHPRSIAIKYLLSKLGKEKIHSRLPYYPLNKDEKEKLNYLF